jgi:hypothetical protein
VNDFLFNRFRPQQGKESQGANHSYRDKKVKVFSASPSLFPASSLPRRSHFETYSIQPDEFSQWNRSTCASRISDWELRIEKPAQMKIAEWTY